MKSYAIRRRMRAVSHNSHIDVLKKISDIADAINQFITRSNKFQFKSNTQWNLL